MNLKSQVNLILSFYTPLVFVHCFEFIFFSEMFLDQTNVEQQGLWCTVIVFIPTLSHYCHVPRTFCFSPVLFIYSTFS